MAEGRSWYLVCYDIRDAKRWRCCFKLLKGYGESLQYSVFRCRLTRRQLERLHWELERELAPECQSDDCRTLQHVYVEADYPQHQGGMGRGSTPISRGSRISCAIHAPPHVWNDGGGKMANALCPLKERETIGKGVHETRKLLEYPGLWNGQGKDERAHWDEFRTWETDSCVGCG